MPELTGAFLTGFIVFVPVAMPVFATSFGKAVEAGLVASILSIIVVGSGPGSSAPASKPGCRTRKGVVNMIVLGARRLLVSVAVFALAHALAQPPVAPEVPSSPLGVVLDLERPSGTDVLLLRNGDRLTGTMLNESISIRTSYASFTFSNRLIAGIDLEGGTNNIETIVTVNDNRFSGFIDDPVFVFRVQSGAQIEIRREKVLSVVFRLRDDERAGISERQFFLLKNGDYFSGRVLNPNIAIVTTYASIPIDLGEVERITLIGGENPLTTVLMLNGDTVQGVISVDDIDIELDVGPTVSIYQDRIDAIFPTTGGVRPSLQGLQTGRATVLPFEVSGRLDSGSARSSASRDWYFDTYPIVLTRDTRIEINMMSSDFDAYLFLVDANGNRLAEDDDGGSGYNARISTSLASGSYEVWAAARGGSTGQYRLTIAAR